MQHSIIAADAASATAVMAEPDYVATPGGHRLFVRDWGSGPPILFLAGWALPCELWSQVMVLLGDQGFRTIAYDRRGHGRSTDPGVIDYDCLADDLAMVMQARELRQCTVVAHSGAAGEVIRYISRHGSTRIARLVFVGAQGPCVLWRDDNPDGVPRDAFEAVMNRLKDDLPGWLDENLEAFIPGASRCAINWVSEMVLRCSGRTAMDFQRVIAEADLRAEVATLTLPLTLIHGDRDASCPIDTTGRRFAALASRASFILYEGAAHGLMITHARRLAGDIAAQG
jgi:non-heme chloroperoxidase